MATQPSARLRNAGCAALHRQRGQSMAELVVLMLVLTPLLLLVPMLGKYGDVAHQTSHASRYLAFEQTVRGPAVARDDTQVVAEARRRVMGATMAPVKTNDVAGNFAAHRNPLWSDYRSNALLPDFNADVTGAAAVSSRTALPGAARFVGDPGFKLPTNNFYSGNMNANPRTVASMPGWDGLNLNTTRRTAILINAWAAASPAEVRQRVMDAEAGPTTPPHNQPYPIGALRLLNESIGRVPTLLLENDVRAWELGGPTPPAFDLQHNPEIVPCDRLVPRPPGC